MQTTRGADAHFGPSAVRTRATELSHDTATSCAFVAGSVSAARAALTGTGATPQSEGLVRVRTQVCLHTCPRPSLGSLPIAINPSPEGVLQPMGTGPAPGPIPIAIRGGRRRGVMRPCLPAPGCFFDYYGAIFAIVKVGR